MTTWGELRAVIREELKDTNALKYRWSDALLYLYLKDALNDYSLWFPVREDRTVLVLSGTGYTLPTDHVNTLFVECPADSYLERRRAFPGVRYPTRSGKPFFFYTQGGKIYLDCSPLEGNNVLLTYEKVHPAPIFVNLVEVLARENLPEIAAEAAGAKTSPPVPLELIVTGYPAGAGLATTVSIDGTDITDEPLTDIPFVLDGSESVLNAAHTVFKSVTSVFLPGYTTIGDAASVGYINDDFVITVPVNDEELIRLYMLAKCYGIMRSRQSALDRFKDRSSSGSDRQDNPLEPETKNLMDEYYDKLCARIGGGTIQLNRTGRIR